MSVQCCVKTHFSTHQGSDSTRRFVSRGSDFFLGGTTGKRADFQPDRTGGPVSQSGGLFAIRNVKRSAESERHKWDKNDLNYEGGCE